MKNLSKICDAADWSDNEFYTVVLDELKEQPRFHRKQWEFAMIFLALKKLGFLNENKTGLSMGGGSERVLYSIAKHVKKLFVTDLYDENTTWDCARTFNPDDFIKQNKPFDIDEQKVTALKMDMRSLEFEDNSFDFCYSSCAFEHIGKNEDFIQHLNEVYRCLKNNGVYVFTTELQLGNNTIEDRNNFIFSPESLQTILNEIKLCTEFIPDATLTDHVSNYPLPSNISKLCGSDDNSLTDKILKDYPHLILLRGKYPFTSIQLILRKKELPVSPGNRIVFTGLENTKKIVSRGLEAYRYMLQNSQIKILPFSSLPDGLSPYYLDHSEFFSKNINGNNDTVFHTDYFWFGSSVRKIQIKLETDEIESGVDNIIQIRLHNYATLNSEKVECTYEQNFNITIKEELNETIIVETKEDYCYAILAKHISGKFRFKSISIISRPLIKD
jgi:ubiquinone/menaquinone biosynthesis C-methylase UbiE